MLIRLSSRKLVVKWKYSLHLALGAQNETWYAHVTTVHAGGTTISSYMVNLISIQLSDAPCWSRCPLIVLIFWVSGLAAWLYSFIFDAAEHSWIWDRDKTMTSPDLQYYSAFGFAVSRWTFPLVVDVSLLYLRACSIYVSLHRCYFHTCSVVQAHSLPNCVRKK